MDIKSLIKKLALMAGYEIRRYAIQSSTGAQFQHILKYHEIDLILDVGANTGQFGHELRLGGFQGRIVSFEPLSGAYSKLLEAARRDPRWNVAPRCAIGDIDGEVEINVSANSESSSMLGMLEAHLTAAPDSRYIGVEKVAIAKLDTVATAVVQGASKIFLKIDAQGYEPRILKGATNLLTRIAGLQVELSLVPLYRDHVLFLDMIRQIRGLGYELHALLPGFADPVTGRSLQVDGVFMRTPAD